MSGVVRAPERNKHNFTLFRRKIAEGEIINKKLDNKETPTQQSPKWKIDSPLKMPPCLPYSSGGSLCNGCLLESTRKDTVQVECEKRTKGGQDAQQKAQRT